MSTNSFFFTGFPPCVGVTRHELVDQPAYRGNCRLDRVGHGGAEAHTVGEVGGLAPHQQHPWRQCAERVHRRQERPGLEPVRIEGLRRERVDARLDDGHGAGNATPEIASTRSNSS